MENVSRDFNTVFHLDKKQEIDKCLESLIIIQRKIIEFYQAFLLSGNFQEQSFVEYTNFFNILAKIRFNMDSAFQLLPILFNDYRFKTSLNVLYRAVVDDLINVFYLLCFVDRHGENQISLKNELVIMHKELLLSAEDMAKAMDKAFDTKHTETLLNDRIKNNIELFNRSTFKLKSNQEIRSSSSIKIYDFLENSPGKFMSEKSKISAIEKKGLPYHFLLTFIYKYLSQYQHYSPTMHDHLLSDALSDIQCYKQILKLSLCAIEDLILILNIDSKADLQKKFNDLVEFVTLKD